MPRHLRLARRAAIALTVLLLAACATGSTHHRTSVVQYLYPKARVPSDTPTVPVLRLPLRIGVAFVPPGGGEGPRGHIGRGDESDVPETERLRLAREITDHFRQRPFVKSVELIPSSYLMPGGGFENLEQLRSMFDVDVMVLLAYDQVQFTGERASAFTYLTVIGAYVVQGEKNDTRTLMDAVVVDVASRKLLFRAPGTSVVKGSATPVNNEEALRNDRMRGFELASRDLVTNLDVQLTAFRERVKEAPEDVRVVRSAEYDRRAAAAGGSGAGAIDPLSLALFAGVAAAGMVASRRRR